MASVRGDELAARSDTVTSTRKISARGERPAFVKIVEEEEAGTHVGTMLNSRVDPAGSASTASRSRAESNRGLLDVIREGHQAETDVAVGSKGWLSDMRSSGLITGLS